LLQEYKWDHEAQYQGSVVDDAALDSFVEEFLGAGSIITTHNQRGRQNVHTIHNVYAQSPHAER
jgi:hypothetical protein